MEHSEGAGWHPPPPPQQGCIGRRQEDFSQYMHLTQNWPKMRSKLLIQGTILWLKYGKLYFIWNSKKGTEKPYCHSCRPNSCKCCSAATVTWKVGVPRVTCGCTFAILWVILHFYVHEKAAPLKSCNGDENGFITLTFFKYSAEFSIQSCNISVLLIMRSDTIISWFGFGIKKSCVFAQNTTVNGFAKKPFFASIQFPKCDLPNKLWKLRLGACYWCWALENKEMILFFLL